MSVQWGHTNAGHGTCPRRVQQRDLLHKEHRESMEKDPLTDKIIGCAIDVHRTLGPGLLESLYKKCLAYECTLNKDDLISLIFGEGDATDYR